MAAQVPASQPPRAADNPPAPPPFIPDEAFEAELPAIDEDLSVPLPPVVMPAAPPLPAAAPLPPVAEAEFAEPLVPLAAFDATPPPPAEETTAEPAVRYSWRVDGADATRMLGRFRELSALARGNERVSGPAVVAARARADEALLQRLLRSEGYFDAIVTSSVGALAGQAGRYDVTLTAVPGERYTFNAVTVIAPPTDPPELARQSLPLYFGDPIVATAVEAAEANINLRLAEQGYPFVSIGDRDIVIDGATLRGDYELRVDPGPRARFGQMTTTGKTAFDADHIAVLARFTAGELYDSRKISDLREALTATGLLATAAVEPVRTGLISADGTERVDLLVRQDAAPPRTLSGSFGYGTGEGFKLVASWQHRNLFPPEGALIADGVLGTQQQGVGVTFRRSNAARRDRTAQIGARALHEDFAAYEAYTGIIAGRISYDSTPIWQKRWTYGYGFELLASDERRADPTRRSDGTYFIAALPAQIAFDSTDALLDARRGFRLMLRASPELAQRTANRAATSGYVRSQIDASGYVAISERLVAAGRVRIGSIAGTSRDAIAPSRRLYAGGGGSVRGFGFQAIGPSDTRGDPLGGRSVAEAAIEARYRFGGTGLLSNFGIVPFIDIGNVYDTTLPRFTGLRAGAGVGLRYFSAFGPLRIDIATPINRRPDEARATLYISIGQAF